MTMRYRKQTEDGDYLFVGNAPFLIDSAAAVAQAIKTRLTLNAGDWFLDDRVGLDLGKVLGNNTQTTRDFEIKRRIGATRGVRSILAYSSTTTPDRKFTVEATVDTIYGPITITEAF